MSSLTNVLSRHSRALQSFKSHKNGEVGKEIRGAVQSLLPARELCEFVPVPIQLAKFSEG